MFNRFLIPFYNLQTGLKTPPSNFKRGLFSSTLIILRSFNPLNELWTLILVFFGTPCRRGRFMEHSIQGRLLNIPLFLLNTSSPLSSVSPFNIHFWLHRWKLVFRLTCLMSELISGLHSFSLAPWLLVTIQISSHDCSGCEVQYCRYFENFLSVSYQNREDH